MKRMFVDARRHGQGIGRALADAAVGQARAAGYSEIWLDTSIRQTEAQNLYRSMGFHTVDAYYDLPPDLVHWLEGLGDEGRHDRVKLRVAGHATSPDRLMRLSMAVR